jgi:glycosyltransferase involved in cell wall biosynthesis
MKISVIMPSFLGEYEGCASDRENKFVRAVHSFLSNKYEHKELIVIGDCCSTTERLLSVNFEEQLNNELIKFYQFSKKQKLFSGELRSKGIELASGDYIIYLDSDDIFGDAHISSVVRQIKNTDWGYYNDFIWSPSGLQTKHVELVKDSIGTSSIYHKKAKGIDWKGCDGYGHDYKFIQKLMKWSGNFDKIYGTSYIICHIPNLIDN